MPPQPTLQLPLSAEMGQDSSITLYEWLLEEFTVDGPRTSEIVAQFGPGLAALVRPGDSVLDLACGAGIWSFFLEERGARVVGIDVANPMIERARRDGAARKSTTEFIEADLLVQDLGDGRFDLAVLMGNTVADFPQKDFASLAGRVHLALKPGGRFVLQYLDGIAYFERERLHPSAVEQSQPVRITRQYKEYRPESAAWVCTYTNEATGETYDYTTYVYPAAMLRVLLEPRFELTQSTRFGEASFLDVFERRQPS